MSLMHSPRAPWVMLALFCGAALVLFFMTIGGDVEELREVTRADEMDAIQNEVRMPIVYNKVPVAEKTPSTEAEPLPVAKQPETRPTSSPEKAEAEPPAETAHLSSAGPGKLLSHSFKQKGAALEATFHTDRPVLDARLFFKSGPALWAVDLPGQWTNVAPRVTDIAKGPISKVVIGRHDDFLRVVFRYRNNNQPQPDEAPEILEEESGFTVRITLKDER